MNLVKTGCYYKFYEHERADGKIAVLQLGGGSTENKGNILNISMIGELIAFFEHIETIPSKYSLLVVTAEGKNFSFGADVEQHLKPDVYAMITLFSRLIEVATELDIPTVVLIQGNCLGGAFEFARCFRKVYVAEDAVFGLPEPTLACFAPDGLAKFPRLTSDMDETILALLTGEVFEASNIDHLRRAMNMGWIDEIFSGKLEDLLERVDIKEINSMPETCDCFHKMRPMMTITVSYIRHLLSRVKISHLSKEVTELAISVLISAGRVGSFRGTENHTRLRFLNELVEIPDYEKYITNWLEEQKQKKAKKG